MSVIALITSGSSLRADVPGGVAVGPLLSQSGNGRFFASLLKPS